MNPENRISRRRFLEIAATTSAVALLSGSRIADASPLPPVAPSTLVGSEFPVFAPLSPNEQPAAAKPLEGNPLTPAVATDSGLGLVAEGYHPYETKAASLISAEGKIAAYRSVNRLMANSQDFEAMRELGIFNGIPEEILEQAFTHVEQHPHMRNTWSETFLIPKGTVTRLTTISGVQELPLPQGLKAAVFIFDGGNLVPESGATEKRIEGTTALHFKKTQDQLSGDVVGLDLGYNIRPDVPEEYKAHITEPLPPLVRFVAKHEAGEQGSRTRTESLVRRNFDPTKPTILVMQSRSGFDNMFEAWALYNGDRGVMTDEQFPTMAKIER